MDAPADVPDTSMKECASGTASPGIVGSPNPALGAAAAAMTTISVQETTHFTVQVHQSSVGRESGDGQSLHDEDSIREASLTDAISKSSLANSNVTYRVKQRLNCPSRSHRSSRCVCHDREEQIRLHNERKRERRRRRQYFHQHQHGVSSHGGGALTDVEHYHVSNYRPKIRTEPAKYSPGQYRQIEDSPQEKPQSTNSSSGAGFASGSQNDGNEGSDGRPKLMDPMQRRKLAKRMMQERRAWTHYFSQPSDGESVCSSMRSAPVLPSGLRLLTLSIDERKDPETQSVVSGVTTCV